MMTTQNAADSRNASLLIKASSANRTKRDATETETWDASGPIPATSRDCEDVLSSSLFFITPFAMTARRDCSFCYRERVTHWNDSTNETAYARHVIAPTSIP